jgi:hypothetical protein
MTGWGWEWSTKAGAGRSEWRAGSWNGGFSLPWRKEGSATGRGAHFRDEGFGALGSAGSVDPLFSCLRSGQSSDRPCCVARTFGRRRDTRRGAPCRPPPAPTFALRSHPQPVILSARLLVPPSPARHSERSPRSEESLFLFPRFLRKESLFLLQNAATAGHSALSTFNF